MKKNYKLKAGDSIQVPEGCTAVIHDGIVTFEPIKEETPGDFVAGDILTSLAGDTMVIFKEYSNDTKLNFDSYCDNRHVSEYLYWTTESFRKATDKEKKRLFSILEARGRIWSPKLNKLMFIRDRVPTGESYLKIVLSDKLCIREKIDYRTEQNDADRNIGNYYHPKHRSEVEEDLEAIKKLFKYRLKLRDHRCR